MHWSRLGCTPIALLQSIWFVPLPMAVASQSLALPAPHRSPVLQKLETYAWQPAIAGAGSAIATKSQVERSLVAVQVALANACVQRVASSSEAQVIARACAMQSHCTSVPHLAA